MRRSNKLRLVVALSAIGAAVAVALAYWYRVTNRWRGTDPTVMMIFGIIGLILFGGLGICVLAWLLRWVQKEGEQYEG